MFNIGDKIICISKDKYDSIKIGLVYTVSYFKGSVLLIEEIDDQVYGQDQFILLLEYRKQKIEKICSKLVTK
jgi:hypothetical protein